jgi:hypothetical protein
LTASAPSVAVALLLEIGEPRMLSSVGAASVAEARSMHAARTESVGRILEVVRAAAWVSLRGPAEAMMGKRKPGGGSGDLYVAGIGWHFPAYPNGL